MLKIEGKTFMNIQEAVQWLLENNALPFQCTANYAPNTEIGLGTIVNPSPAKVRIGSLIFFADSKVSTVVGITETGFICSDQYNSLVDDITYVSNVEIDASGHLICTLSNGDTIDAGLIKQVVGFSIDASQHLIVSYNDSSTTDLGAIFTGNVNISGNLTANSIIENMSGYTADVKPSTEDTTVTPVYYGVVKNGNKITFVCACKLTKVGSTENFCPVIFTIPGPISDQLYPVTIGGQTALDFKNLNCNSNIFNAVTNIAWISKPAYKKVQFNISTTNLVANTEYYVRYEATFLLSDPLNP